MMKKSSKWIALALALAVLAALFAGCTENGPSGTEGTEQTESSSKEASDNTESGSDVDGKFTVGFGRREIMPDESVRIGAYGTVRWSTGFYSRMYVSCIAITDKAGETALLISWEATAGKQTVVDEMKAQIKEQLGVPADHVHITATHNHGTPDLNVSNQSNVRYVNSVIAKTVESAAEALADRKEATIRVGSTVVDGMNFVRHYISESGMARGDNYSNSVIDPYPLVKHVADPDRTIQFIRFCREGDKDVLFTAWRAHNSLGCSSESVNLTGGFTEAYCRNTEKKLDCYCAYFQCDSGRINPNSRIKEDVPQYEKDQQEEFGEKLSEYAAAVYDTLEPVESGNLKFISTTFTGKINHTQDGMVSQAQRIKTLWDAQSITAAEGMNMANEINKEMGLTYYEGIHSVYHANYIITKATSGPTRDIETSLLAIGDDIAITFDPYEMFDTSGSYIRANSPYKFTVTCSYTDGALAYIPSEDAYGYGCYEADACVFVKGTAEEFANKFLELLGELKKQ